MRDILKKVFGDESITAEEFERRLSTFGKYELIGNDELDMYSSLSDENRQLKEELDHTVSENLIERELSRQRVRNFRAARAVIDDGDIFGENGLDEEKLGETVMKIKAEYPYLFENGEPAAEQIFSTGRNHGRSFSRDYSRMSDAEYYRTINNNK